MNILTFIKINKRIISFFAVVIMTANFIFLTSANLGKSIYDILYFNFLIFVFSTIYGITSYRSWINKYKPLKEALENDEKINLGTIEEDSFYTILLKNLIKNKNLEIDIRTKELKKSIDELNDYITKWVHEIKIPVSVCELILERLEDCTMENELQTELERIKFLTNQVLYISRASSYSEDLYIREVNLNKVVKNSIRRNSTLLISKNIEISISNLDFNVLTDEKWISYIIDQLLHNSYKYTNQDGMLEIGACLDENNNIKLSVRDNGIGILPKDISRIFDKSFTGNNKSNITKSTGMGLYITKKMLDKLGHKIEVQSEPNVFTQFTITFYRISHYELNISDKNSEKVFH